MDCLNGVRAQVAKAAVENRHPFPTGIEAQPFQEELIRDLLNTHFEWTLSASEFIRTIFSHRQDGLSLEFSEIESAAKKEFFATHPDEITFPRVDFQDFMNKAWRFGLLAKDFQVIPGDPRGINSPDRRVLYQIQERGWGLIDQMSAQPFELTIPLLTMPPTPITVVSSKGAALLSKIAQLNGILMDDILDDLSETEYAETQRLIESLSDDGLLIQNEDTLGAVTLSVSPAGHQALMVTIPIDKSAA